MTFPTFDFADLMNFEVVVSPLASVNRYAEEVYSTASSTHPAHVEYKYQNVIDFMGNEVVSNTEVILASTFALDATAQFTLPDGSTPHLVSMTRIEDEGIHYHFLYFGGAGG